MVQQTTSWAPPAVAQAISGRPIDRHGAQFMNTSTVPNPPPTLRREGPRLLAAEGATLPERCACCGDTVELRPFRTFVGRVRYFVCRDHCVDACARICVGLVMMLIGGLSLGMPILDGGLPSTSTLISFGAVFVAGAVMAWTAIPVRAGRNRGGWRTLSGVCESAARDV